MSIQDLSAELTAFGTAHRIVLATAHYKPVVTASYDSDEADALTVHFKSTSERNKDRKKAKIYRQKNKAKLRLKAKKYALKMKHKKPNALRSRIAKLVAKHYHH